MEAEAALEISGRTAAAGAVILLVLYLTSLHSYLLFHSLVELFTITVAAGVFVVAWNARRYLDNNYLLLVGIASVFAAVLDLLHTLAYRGMGVFGGTSSNLATQLWIAARYLQGLSLLTAPFVLGRRLSARVLLAVFGALTAAILLSIFYWRVFPVAYVEGAGLTQFKKTSEYVISVLLLAATGLLYRQRAEFDRSVRRLLGAFLVLTIASELAFTSYVSVYGPMNGVGHLLRLVAFWLLYKAIIETGLVKPYAILHRSLAASQEQLREYAAQLEARNRELRRTEAQLREDAAILQSRNAELDAFAHTVAHDLKDPLAALVASAAAVRAFADLPREQVVPMLTRLENTAMSMSGIVDGLLMLSQVRKVDAPVQPVDMGEVVASVRRRLAHVIGAHGATIVAPDRWPVASGYAVWLEEVWANYVSNALKYGGKPPRVELGWAPADRGMVRFWVRDNGPGVAERARERLFVPFSQFGKVGKTGHGLGLSIVLQIVEKLGGEVGVETSPSAGSLFWFTLPLARSQRPAGPVPMGAPR